jgi:hypothetical protein
MVDVLVNVGDFSWNSGVLVLASAGLVGSAVLAPASIRMGVEAEWWDREVVKWVDWASCRSSSEWTVSLSLYRYLVRLEAIQRQ